MLLCSNYILPQSTSGILETEVNSDVASLVRDVFIKGSCKNVSNITSEGEQQSIGVFRKAKNIIGLTDGIILCTGDVKIAEGPNNFVDSSSQFNKPSRDKDLRAIATDELFDVVVLEFDFIPIESEVIFKYVFASEEYCEFVGTDFNDVFGFFVSGPGIDGPYTDGAINVATIPQSNEFVSINSVNHESNQDLYVKNELRDDVGNCDIEFNATQIDALEYDGFTVPMVARFRVTPCETYHIRLVVGDVADDKLDSAVFLESNSFDLGEVATVRAFVPNQEDDIAYENCLDGQFIFERPQGSFNLNPLQINFEIDSRSTASEGVDFTSIPRSVTIPAGEDSFSLAIQSLLDGQDENLERLRLNLNLELDCECQVGSSATLFFADALPPEISIDPIYACVDQEFTIVPQVMEGVPPFSFRWEDNSSDTSLTTSVLGPRNFGVSVTDHCNNEVRGAVDVGIQEMPSAELSGDVEYCTGLSGLTLPLEFNGFPPWSFSYQIDDDTLIVLDNIFDIDFELPISKAGSYSLVEFSDAACRGEALGSGLVDDINITLATGIISPTCPSTNDGQISLDILSGSPPFDIAWSPTVNDQLNPDNLSVGIYELIIRDDKSCTLVDSFEIVRPDIITTECVNSTLYVPNVFSPDGDGVNDYFEVFVAERNNVLRITKVEVSDRWGNVVYLANNVMPLWDGRFNGAALNPGVYYYKIQIRLVDNSIRLLQGSLTLTK